jgi:hypothetical protein
MARRHSGTCATKQVVAGAKGNARETADPFCDQDRAMARSVFFRGGPNPDSLRPPSRTRRLKPAMH